MAEDIHEIRLQKTALQIAALEKQAVERRKRLMAQAVQNEAVRAAMADIGKDTIDLSSRNQGQPQDPMLKFVANTKRAAGLNQMLYGIGQMAGKGRPVTFFVNPKNHSLAALENEPAEKGV